MTLKNGIYMDLVFYFLFKQLFPFLNIIMRLQRRYLCE